MTSCICAAKTAADILELLKEFCCRAFGTIGLQGLIEKRLLSMVLRMPVKKKLLGTARQGANLWPAPAEITGQDDYKKFY